MNRRSFLKTTAAAVAVTQLPALPQEPVAVAEFRYHTVRWYYGRSLYEVDRDALLRIQETPTRLLESCDRPLGRYATSR